MKLFVLTILTLFSLNVFSAMLGEERDWAFIQGVGGIKIGEPKQENNKWLLPVYCNVTGITEYTIKPTMLNSGLVWADTEVHIKKNTIYISIETSLTGFGSKSSLCGAANLGSVKTGKYKVMYLSPDKTENYLGDVSIGL